MVSAIDGYRTRPKRTFQEDGLMDIACGFAILALALSLYGGILESRMMAELIRDGVYPPTAWKQASDATWMTSYVSFLIPLSFHAAMFLKRRFVYPRVGYSKPREAPNPLLQKAFLLVASVTVMGLIGFCLPRWKTPGFWTGDMTLVTIGFGLAAVLVVNYLKLGFVRHLVIAGVSAVASLLIAVLPLDWQHSHLAFAVVMGISFLISGAFPFAKILRLPVLSEDDAG
jgi:hypothetical protein